MKCDTTKCNAWCCRIFWWRLEKEPSPDMKLYFEYHGVKVDGNVLTFPLKCKFLTDKNKCAIYKNRPKICKEWDCGINYDTAKIRN